MKRKQQVDPKTFRKHSKIVHNDIETKGFVVVGDREQTKTGFTITGTKCADFETFYEYMADGQLSTRVVHPTKSRSFRAIAGQGVMVVYKDGASRALALIPGTEVTAVPGIAYEIRSSNTPLELYITQAADYDDELEIVQTSEVAPAVLTPGQLRSVSRAEAMESQFESTGSTRRPRRESKAAQQQLAKAEALGRVVPTFEPAAAGVTPVMNVKPSMGRFDDEGAG